MWYRATITWFLLPVMWPVMGRQLPDFWHVLSWNIWQNGHTTSTWQLFFFFFSKNKKIFAAWFYIFFRRLKWFFFTKGVSEFLNWTIFFLPISIFPKIIRIESWPNFLILIFFLKIYYMSPDIKIIFSTTIFLKFTYN
jgi:hypothetical protein